MILLVSHLTLSKVFRRLCTFPAQQRPLPGQIPKEGKHRKCSGFNSSASEVTTDQGAILRKQRFHLPDRPSIFAGTSQQITFSELAVPTHAKLQSGYSEAAQLLRAGSATAFSHKLFLSLLLLPPCIGDSSP